MKNFIVATVNNETGTYKYSKLLVTILEKDNLPFVVLGKLSGKTYDERKAELISRAIDFQNIDVGGLSYGEIAEIQAYFETYGKRYGLLREFKENCIC